MTTEALANPGYECGRNVELPGSGGPRVAPRRRPLCQCGSDPLGDDLHVRVAQVEVTLLHHHGVVLLFHEGYPGRQSRDVPVNVGDAITCAEAEDVEALGLEGCSDRSAYTVHSALETDLLGLSEVIDDFCPVLAWSKKDTPRHGQSTWEKRHRDFILEDDVLLLMSVLDEITDEALASLVPLSQLIGVGGQVNLPGSFAHHARVPVPVPRRMALSRQVVDAPRCR